MMINYFRCGILTVLVIALAGCAGGKPSMWDQFHGDLSSQGFQKIESGFALSSSWISNPYRITSSSPVIGVDFQGREVIYVGTTNGKLIAIRSEDGTEKWQRPLGVAGSEARIVSSASVSDRGDIYVISSRKTIDGRLQSTLHKVDQFSNPKWSYSFPDNGYTSGSPKVITTPTGTLIFVYVSVGMIDDVQGELFVLHDDGNRAELLDHKALGRCRFDAAVTVNDVMNSFSESWELIGNFPVEMGKGNAVLTDRFVDPTVAIYKAQERPLIAIADSLCSIGVFEWSGNELAVLWREEHAFDKHSSAAVLANGLMVFGGQDGKVVAFDIQTGVEMWEYKADQAVFATPAGSTTQVLFIVSKDHLQVINSADGSLVHDDNFSGKLPLLGFTHSSPAATVNLVYVSSYEMLTATYDLKTRASDTNFRGNGLSSVAIGGDGAVYVVAVDGTIRKYAGTK